jgi:hypothetical protein
LGKVGFNLAAASVLVAILGYVGAMLVVFAWCSRHYAPVPAVVLASLVAMSVPIVRLARISTPDSLAVLLVLLGAFSLIELRRARVALAVLAVGVLARPNTLVLLLLLTAYLAIWAPPDIALSTPVAIVAGVVEVGLYLALSTVSGMYPIATLLYFATVEALPYPATFSSPLGLVDYLSIYAFALLQFEFLFVLIGLIVIRLRRATSPHASDTLAPVTLLVLLSMPFQWVVYPTEALRTMAPQFALLVIFLVVSASAGVGAYQRRRTSS